MRRVAVTAAVFGVATILATGSRTVHAAPISTNSKSNTAGSKTVTVQPGDYLSKIATAYNSTAERLFDANPQISNPDLIYPGQKLRIPSTNEKLTERPYGHSPAITAVAAVTQTTASAAPAISGPSVWMQLAQCESGGNWSINTGNGYYGGLQFTLGSWQAVGGSGYPNLASAGEQIARGQILQARQGWGAWPACSAKLGL